MKKTFREALRESKRVLILIVILSFSLLLFYGNQSIAASAKTENKKTAPSLKINKNTGHKKTLSTSSPVGRVKSNVLVTPSITIEYFKGDVIPSGPAGSYVRLPGPAGGSVRDSITIKYGDSIKLKWRVKTCNEDDLMVYINDSCYSWNQRHESAGNGCTYWQGEKGFTPVHTTVYTLKVVGSPHRVIRQKYFTVHVPRPKIDIQKPLVNQDNLNVTISMRNSGDADLESARLQVEYFVNRKGTEITSGHFVTSPLNIRHGGPKVDLGSFSLDRYRTEVFADSSIKIKVRISCASAGIYQEKEFLHHWKPKRFIIDNTLLSLLSSLSGYDIRLNNYGGGVHPYVANDCHFSLTIMGTEVGSGNFSIEPFVENVLIAIPPNPVPVRQQVAIYINNVVSSQTGASDFLSIRRGKLVIHLNFPNSGSREIKTGFHNWGRHNEFRDNPVGDVELGPFTVDVLLTPSLRNGKVSYNYVEVQTHDINASVVGALDRTLNRSGMVRRFLNNTISNIIVSYLTSLLSSDNIRTAFENGIANNLPRNITRITGMINTGNKITIEYL